MLVSISGSSKAKFNNVVYAACEYYLNRLVSSRLRKHIMIDIEFRKRLDDDADGYCEVSGVNARNKPREFTIQIQKNKSERYMLMTLAHEMVHLKQYVMGELDETMDVWNGKRVSSKVSYWDSPWEIEARGRELGLYVQFCEKHNLEFKKLYNERDF